MFAKRPLEVIILDQSCLFKVNKGQTYFISVYIYWNTDTRVEKYHFNDTVKILDWKNTVWFTEQAIRYDFRLNFLFSEKESRAYAKKMSGRLFSPTRRTTRISYE